MQICQVPHLFLLPQLPKLPEIGDGGGGFSDRKQLTYVGSDALASADTAPDVRAVGAAGRLPARWHALVRQREQKIELLGNLALRLQAAPDP